MVGGDDGVIVGVGAAVGIPVGSDGDGFCVAVAVGVLVGPEGRGGSNAGVGAEVDGTQVGVAVVGSAVGLAVGAVVGGPISQFRPIQLKYSAPKRTMWAKFKAPAEPRKNIEGMITRVGKGGGGRVRVCLRAPHARVCSTGVCGGASKQTDIDQVAPTGTPTIHLCGPCG